MTDREKLIELLLSGDKTVQCEHSPEVNCDGTKCAFCERVEIADRLIANGVTFAKDTNVPSKWISVEDRLPEEARVPKDVLVYHKLGNCGSYVDRAWYDRDKRKWRSALGMNMNVTHWMPMPEPPRVQEVPNGTDHV